MSIVTLTSENYEEEVLRADKPVLVDFYAQWCGPCQRMAPIIEQIAQETKESIKVGKVNVDENQELAMKYEISSIPTILLIKEEEIKNTFVGVRDKSEILNAIGKIS